MTIYVAEISTTLGLTDSQGDGAYFGEATTSAGLSSSADALLRKAITVRTRFGMTPSLGATGKYNRSLSTTLKALTYPIFEGDTSNPKPYGTIVKTGNVILANAELGLTFTCKLPLLGNVDLINTPQSFTENQLGKVFVNSGLGSTFNEKMITLKALCEDVKDDLMVFLAATVGLEIKYTDMENTEWRVCVTNYPIEVIPEKDNRFTVDLRFRGVRW